MAKKTDPAALVAGAGLLMTIFTRLRDEVVKRGGTADDLHRLTRPEGRDLIGKMADLIVPKLGDGAVYTEEVDYDDPALETIGCPRYAYVGDVTAADYPVTRIGRHVVRFRELEFDHDASDDEVLAEAERENCRQPDRAEAETAIRRYTPEQLGKNPRIGLSALAVQCNGYLDRAYVRGCEIGVGLDWSWTRGRWGRRCRFVVVCKDA